MIKQVKLALLVLRQLIHSEDEAVLSDACWAMFYLSRGTDDNAGIEAVIETLDLLSSLGKFFLFILTLGFIV